MKHLLIVIMFVGALVACNNSGTAPSPGYIEIPGEASDADIKIKTIAAATDMMLEKAIAFRTKTGVRELTLQSTSSGKYAGIYVYSRSIDKYKSTPEKLAARLALLGFTDIYLSVSNNALLGQDATMQSWLRVFNAKMSGYGARVHALRLSDTKSYVSDTHIYNDVEAITAFNASVTTPSQKFAGASADFEPHVLKLGGANTPPNLPWHWDSTNGYGVDGSNDKLLKKTIELLTLAARELGELPLSEAISYTYQARVNDRTLKWGSMQNFLTPCNHILAMVYNNKKESIWSRFEPVLNAATLITPTKERTTVLCIKTSLNTVGDGGDITTSLQPQGWSYLLSCLDYFATKTNKSTIYKGICVFELDGFEQMWEWTKDSK